MNKKKEIKKLRDENKKLRDANNRLKNELVSHEAVIVTMLDIEERMGFDKIIEGIFKEVRSRRSDGNHLFDQKGSKNETNN